MRLLDLEPHWIQPNSWAELAPPFYIGVSFLCPHCATKGACPTCGHFEARRLAVMFWPPIDPTAALGRRFEYPATPNAHTRGGGETFDALTLTPSIDFDSIGHWHGNITNGEAVP